MDVQEISWGEALELLNKNISVAKYLIKFDEQIHIDDVIVFNKNGINVPENLIKYDDENIDCSDIPEITLDDINSGKLVKVLTAQIKIDNDTENWINKSNINYNELLSNLLNNFYQSVKNLPNKAAL